MIRRNNKGDGAGDEESSCGDVGVIGHTSVWGEGVVVVVVESTAA